MEETGLIFYMKGGAKISFRLATILHDIRIDVDDIRDILSHYLNDNGIIPIQYNISTLRVSKTFNIVAKEIFAYEIIDPRGNWVSYDMTIERWDGMGKSEVN